METATNRPSASSRTAPPNDPPVRQGARLVASFAEAIGSILAVTVTIVAFAGVSCMLVMLRSVGVLLERGRILTLADRYPVLTAVLASAGGVVCAGIGRVTADTAISIAWGVAVVASSAVVAHALPRALSVPATLDAIEAHVGTDPICRATGGFLRRRADAVWIRSAAILSLVVLPVAVGAALPMTSNAVTMGLYAVVVLLTTSATNAFEHADAHYNLAGARREGATNTRLTRVLAHLWLVYVLPLFYARTPHWYRIQHVVVHHAEDNGVEDTQSTVRYDRASFIDFARCANKFALSNLVAADVIAYLVRHHRNRALRALFGGLGVFASVAVALAMVNWRFAVAFVVVKYTASLLTALGFFQEHGTVDTAEPQNVYRNSLHYLAADNTHGSLGDDVHIEHHVHPGAHWSEYIARAAANEHRYAAEGALALRDHAGSLQRYYQLLWRRDFVELASMFVVFGSPGASVIERADLLRDRTRPLMRARRTGALDRLDRAFGRLAGHLVPDA